MSNSSEKPNAYLEVRLEVPTTLSDAVCNFIIDNICSGLVLEEEEGSSLTSIAFYVPTSDDKDYVVKLGGYLAELVGEEMPSVPALRRKVIRNLEWTEQYKKSIKSIRVDPDVLIRPPWAEVPAGIKQDIIIEPKMAFGTGSHETTRTCLRLIRGRFNWPGRFLDVGCGSGVLSILADRMGATYIKAIDYDIAAVDNTNENFVINKVKAPHEVILGSLEQCENDEPYGFVAVNIIKSVILPRISQLAALVAKGGTMILSGLLEPDLPEVSAALREAGLDNYETVNENEWFSFIVVRD